MHHSPTHISSKPRLSWPRLPVPRANFTPQEVRRRLQVDRPESDTDDDRTAAVHAVAALTGAWASDVPDRLAFDLGRAAARLPSIVYWYRQGLSEHEIGRRISPLGSAWDADRALDAAATLIAAALNR